LRVQKLKPAEMKCLGRSRDKTMTDQYQLLDSLKTTLLLSFIFDT